MKALSMMMRINGQERCVLIGVPVLDMASFVAGKPAMDADGDYYFLDGDGGAWQLKPEVERALQVQAMRENEAVGPFSRTGGDG